MIRKLKGAAVFATMLLFTMGTANAATISINKSITIASANDGPLVFDFGVVSAGVAMFLLDRCLSTLSTQAAAT